MSYDNEQDQTSLSQNQFDYTRRVFADPTMAPQYESLSAQLAQLTRNINAPGLATGQANPLIPGSVARASPYLPTAGQTSPLHPWMQGQGQQPIMPGQMPANVNAATRMQGMMGAPMAPGVVPTAPTAPTMPASQFPTAQPTVQPTQPTQPTPVAGAGGLTAPPAPGVGAAQRQQTPPQPQILSDEEMPDGHYLNTAGQPHPPGAPGSPMNIHVKPSSEQMMDWNKPFQQQPEAVQAALQAMHPQGTNLNGQTGSQMYMQQVINHMMQQKMGYSQAKTAASQTFNNNGVPGTTISDGNNSGVVVFHPSNLEYSANGYQLQPVDYQPTFATEQAQAQGQPQQ